jgi:DNA processing protein
MASPGCILLNIAGLHPDKNAAILDFFGSPEALAKPSANVLSQVPGLSNEDVRKLVAVSDNGVLDKELALVEKNRIKVIDIFQQDYPALLKEIARPPLVLYLRGDAAVLSQYCLAVVGTRIPTMYGLEMAEEFTRDLARFGIVIVSGLARGIDSQAHKTALKFGRTVAVLGSGLLNVYPRENEPLAEKIAASGAVISEFSLTMPPLKENFPRRNRVVSGLCRGVLVVEAAAKSGALITAHLALEQNREVFAVPGKADSELSRGTHQIIKEGAKLVENARDIFDELNIKVTVQDQDNTSADSPVIRLDPQSKKVFDIVAEDSAHFDDLLLKTGCTYSALSKIVLDLELKGFIKEISPSCYVRITARRVNGG